MAATLPVDSEIGGSSTPDALEALLELEATLQEMNSRPSGLLREIGSCRLYNYRSHATVYLSV